MALVVAKDVELAGPLAAERRVLLEAAVRQFELALADCGGFDREELADHSIALTGSVERASVVSARFAAVPANHLRQHPTTRPARISKGSDPFRSKGSDPMRTFTKALAKRRGRWAARNLAVPVSGL